MSKQRKIDVLGVSVTIKKVEQDDYISLTDIAKSDSGQTPANLIRSWLKNQRTLRFLSAWERAYNENFKNAQMDVFRLQCTEPRFNASVKSYTETTNAIGLISKAGRYGAGTYAHLEIALSFAYWLEPEFQVFFLKEFNRMKKEETFLIENTRKWAFEKLLRSAEEIKTVSEFGLSLDEEE